MMSKAKLLELIEKVDGLDGPCRDIDHEIRAIVVGDDESLLSYTASLDDAMTLVPEKVGITIDRYWSTNTKGPAWSAGIYTGGLPTSSREIFEVFDCSSAALAVTAAALRIRAMQALVKKEKEQ